MMNVNFYLAYTFIYYNKYIIHIFEQVHYFILDTRDDFS